MKKTLVALSALLAMSMAFVSCGGAGSDPTANANRVGEEISVPGGKFSWSAFEITDYTKLAKPGAKLHMGVAKALDGADEYCKVQFLDKDWGDSGITEITKGNMPANIIQFQLEAEGNPCHRPYIEGEGDYTIVLNDAALAKSSLAIMGNATVEYLTIEYVGGKKEVAAGDENVIWTGSVTLNFSDEANRVKISASDIITGTTGLRITYNSEATGTGIKIVDNTTGWEEVKISASGLSGSPDGKTLYLDGEKTGETVDVTFEAEVLSGFIGATGGNVIIYGDSGVTITKVERIISAGE